MAFTINQLETFSETKPELRYVTEEIIKYLVANPSGGGGATPTLDQVLAAGATLTANRTVDLNAKSLTIQENNEIFLLLDATPDAEISTLRAFNITGDENIGQLRVSATPTEAKFLLEAEFNAVKQVAITGTVESGLAEIEYEADSHKFNGDAILVGFAGGGVTTASIDDTGKLIRTP